MNNVLLILSLLDYSASLKLGLEPVARKDPEPKVRPDLGGKLPDAFPKEKIQPGSIFGRGGAIREQLARDGGGTAESEAAVARGLQWLTRQQDADGHWPMDGKFPDKGPANDTAGTAFGLLPFLGAGFTHKASPRNPHDKVVEKGLQFLIRKQDRQSGNLGGGMYAHALAALALCEAYGLSQDPILRAPAQRAVNYIVNAQHNEGGWRYAPLQPGDTSVTGWQLQVLVTAKMVGLDVPMATSRKAQQFLDSVCKSGPTTEGYGYMPKSGDTPTMTAVGLLYRQYLQGWGPKNIRMINGIETLKKNPPGSGKGMYYQFYATQVMHHFGGDEWKAWNEKMRDQLIKGQDKGTGPQAGSWSSTGEPHGAGRLMTTSLSLLTLEVYYRHVPLSARPIGQ